MKNKGGRPRKTDEEKRALQIHLLLNKEENEILRKKWNQSQYPTLRQYIMDLATKRNICYPVICPSETYDALLNLQSELGKIGTNINQIAKVCNTFNAPPPELASALDAFAKTMSELSNKLNDIKTSAV